MRRAKSAAIVAICLWLLPFILWADAAADAYQRAMDHYRAFQKSPDKQKLHHNWENLIAEFRKIADTYPKSEKADDALFMAGKLNLDCYKISQRAADRDAALDTFQSLISKYPKSPLADDAYFMRGEIYRAMGNNAAARKEYGAIVKNYPRGDKVSQAKKDLAGLPAAPEPKQAKNPGKPKPEIKPAEKEKTDDDAAGKKSKPQPAAPALSDDDTGPACATDQRDYDQEIVSRSVQEIARNIQMGNAAAEPAENPPEAPDLPEEEVKPAPAAAGPLPERIGSAAEDVNNLPSAPAARGRRHEQSNTAQLLSIRYRSAKDYTRIVIDLDREVQYLEPHPLRPDPQIQTPPRLYVDFLGTVLSPQLKQQMPQVNNCYNLPISDGLLLKARAAQFQQDVVRVVLDIDSIERYRAFPLMSEEGYYRYVIDVFGKKQGPAASPDVAAAPLPQPAPGAMPSAPGKKGPLPKPTRGSGQILIVVDAGHGGKDPGAIGPTGLREKDITLAVARKLKRELESSHRDVKVVLTRDSDNYITLVDRTSMANELNAALFISLHCNWAQNRSATGIETYYLDNTNDKATLRLAAKENFTAGSPNKSGGDETNKILADLIQSTKVDDSIPLAHHIQRSLVTTMRQNYKDTLDRNVKKAPFWVLVGATMPCVLVEMEFVSNYGKERMLASEAYQNMAAKSIARGIEQYLIQYPQMVVARGE